MTMGKGGVGKTTLAVRIATQLAQDGYKVLLTTTDRQRTSMPPRGNDPRRSV